MFSLRWFSRSILSFLVLTALVTTAMSGESPKPSGKVTMESKSIAVGIGVTWGDGKLNFKGKDYPFSIDGLTVVDFGISKASATGDVYNLADVAKFAGTYAAGEAGFALAGGMGGMVLRNQDGVVLRTLDIPRRQAATRTKRTGHKNEIVTIRIYPAAGNASASAMGPFSPQVKSSQEVEKAEETKVQMAKSHRRRCRRT